MTVSATNASNAKFARPLGVDDDEANDADPLFALSLESFEVLIASFDDPFPVTDAAAAPSPPPPPAPGSRPVAAFFSRGEYRMTPKGDWTCLLKTRCAELKPTKAEKKAISDERRRLKQCTYTEKKNKTLATELRDLRKLVPELLAALAAKDAELERERERVAAAGWAAAAAAAGGVASAC